MKYLQTFEGRKKQVNFSHINYEDAVKWNEMDNKIRKHIEENYPDNYYTKDNNVLGRYGKGLTLHTINRVSRLARNNDDVELLKIANEWIDFYNNHLLK